MDDADAIWMLYWMLYGMLYIGCYMDDAEKDAIWSS